MKTPKCLFLNTPLDSSTKEEHVIQKCLCGKIKSPEVTSTEINEAAGKCIENDLSDAYLPLRIILAPLLKSEHQGIKVHGVSHDGRNKFFISDGWDVEGKIHDIVNDDGSISKIGPEKKITELVNRLGSRVKMQSNSILDVTEVYGDLFYFAEGTPVLTPFLIASISKTVLCTLDYYLNLQNGLAPLTRTGDLTEFTDLVKNAILFPKCIDAKSWDRYFLGMQYDRIAEIYSAMGVFGESIPEVNDFSHILMVTGSQGTKSVQAIFLAFGFDPYGYVLSENWNGGDFSYLFKQGIFAGDVPGKLKRVDSHVPLCRRTGITPFASHEEEARRSAVRAGHEKEKALHRALFLVEMSEANNLRMHFTESARLSFVLKDNDYSILDLFISRLVKLEVSGITSVDIIHERISQNEDLSIRVADPFYVNRHQAIDALNNLSDSEWDKIVRLYRDILIYLKGEFGSIGVFVRSNPIVFSGSPDKQDITYSAMSAHIKRRQ